MKFRRDYGPINSDKYYKDDTTDMNYRESHFSKVALLAGGLALGVVGYKKGVFKDFANKTIRRIGGEKSRYPNTLGAIREWVNGTKEIVNKRTMQVPKTSHKKMDIQHQSRFDKLFDEGTMSKSFFRDQDYKKLNFKLLAKHSTQKQFFTDMKQNLDKLFDPERWKHTQSDFKGLKKYVEEFNKDKLSIEDTKLFRMFREIKGSVEKISVETSPERGKQAEYIMIQKLIELSKDNAKKQATTKKRTGLKQLTLGDVVNIRKGKDKQGISHFYIGETGKNTNNIKLSENERKHIASVANFEYAPGKKIGDLDMFATLEVDDTMFITDDNNREIFDLRGFRNGLNTFTSSLATDFTIPVIKINPFRILGFGELGIKKTHFATLSKHTIQNTLLNKQGKDGLLQETMFFAGDSVYRFTDTGTELVKKNMHVTRVIQDSNLTTKEMDSVRKIAGLSKIEYDKYGADDGFKSWYSTLAQKLDLGFSDLDMSEKGDLGHGSLLNPNTYVNNLMEYLSNTKLLRTHKGIVNQNIDSDTFRAAKTYTEIFTETDEVMRDVYIATNNTLSLKDVFTSTNTDGERHFSPSSDIAKKYIRQYVAGRSNIEDVTKRTTDVFYFFDRVNSTLALSGFGLGVDSLTSSQGIVGNLLLKRALPVYGAYVGYQQIVALTESKDEDDPYTGTTNIQKKGANVIAGLSLAYHKVKDITGITGLAETIEPYMPGIDQIAEIPGLNAVKLSTSYDEQVEYYKDGVDPIRKGRFWDSGTTPFTGGKVERYRASWYRRAMAEVEFSDSKYGSRDEYLSNLPIPTLSNPLAPIKHFITDKYHWEEKHYDDRPYLQTSPMFQEVPFVGPLLSSTIGRVIKPIKNMHEEDMQRMNFSDVREYNEELIDLTGQGNGIVTMQREYVAGGGSPFPQPTTLFGMSLPTKATTLSNFNPGVSFGTIPNDGLFTIARGIQDDTMTKIDEDDYENITDKTSVASYTPFTKGLNSQAGISYNLGHTYNQASDFFGLYGFMTSSVFGEANDTKMYIDNPSYAFSMSKSFWDSSIGGLGGEANEIARRFLRKQVDQEQLYNPIRNTMPNYLPGESGFINFQYGDPFSKIANGEERLPGEGYERLHQIKPFDMKIGSSFLGKDVNGIMNHLLNHDEITSEEGQSIVNKGTRIHKQIEKELLASGRAINSEQEIYDKENNITGTYDVLVRSNDTSDGQIVMDIKTVNATKFEKIRSTGEIQQENKEQVNFYVHHLGLEKGGIMYVNRDNPDERTELFFDYDAGLYNHSVSKVHEARENINEMLDTGQLSRGDLYSPIDKLRILGDVAPYSEEYENMLSYVTAMDLNDEKKAELKEIKTRVSEQRNPKRFYEYQFQDFNTKSEGVEVDAVLEGNLFTIKGHTGKFRLAGIDIKSEDEFETEYEANLQKEIISSYLHEGSNIRITYNEDEATRNSNSGVTKVIVEKFGEGELNQTLVDRKMAEYNDSESDIDLKVRTTAIGRLGGKIWEEFAHMDTPFHTKFLQVRSATEDYERSRVYGSPYARWEEPIEDYFKPFVIDRNVERGFLTGIFAATTIGTMFGDSKFGRIIGGVTAGLLVTKGKLFAMGHKIVTGEKWRPERVEKEQEMSDYVDKLKYIKYKKLFHKYANLSEEEKNIFDDNKSAYDILNLDYNMEKKQKQENKKLNNLKRIMNNKLAKGEDTTFLETVHGFGVPGHNPFVNVMKNIFKGSKSIEKAIKIQQEMEDYKANNDMSNVENARVDPRKAIDRFKDALKDGEENITINGTTDVKQEFKNAFDVLLGAESGEDFKKGITQHQNNLKKRYAKTNPLESQDLDIDKLSSLAIVQHLLQDERSTDKEILEKMTPTGIAPYTNKRGIVDRKRTLEDVNKSILSISSALGLSENTMKALMYHKLSEQTMYAFDPGDNIQDYISAMPKADKDYFMAFANAPDKEKDRILELTPKYMRRGLQSMWGLQSEKKENLAQYFTEHALPDAGWVGWNEDVDLDSVKVKMLKKEDMDFENNNVWEEDVAKANAMGNIPIPKVDAFASSNQVRQNLQKIFHEGGYKDIQIDMKPSLRDNDSRLYITTSNQTLYRKEIKKKSEEYFGG